MNINRNNYEEFFLLYVDNELNVEERTAVENFAEQNPDLGKELEMLQQVTLADDTVQFEQKEVLFKTANSIALENYEEYFLLSVDNELSEQQRHEVEKFVLQHPELQDEFTVIQDTKLVPGVIPFIGKSALYRKEKQRRVIPVAWLRMSAAAAVAGLIALTWVTLLPYNSGNSVASSEKTINKLPGKNSPRKTQQPVTEQPVAALQTEKGKKDIDEASTVTKTVTGQKVESIAKNKVEKTGFTVTKQQPELVKEPVVPRNALAATNKPVANPKIANTGASTGNDVNSGNSSDLAKDNSAEARPGRHNEVKEEPMLATRALYKEIDSDDEEKVLYIGAARINKNKLKGLFKKAANFLDKKSNHDDNEKTLRIASFEIKSN